MELLLAFHHRAIKDLRILPSHISVYLALLVAWTENGAPEVMEISRRVIMNAARINSRTTYHKCMSDLDAFGYILYYPSMDACRPNKVVIKELKTE